jgi:hypothetical protein
MFLYFSTFCLTDRTGRCLAVNLYNLAPGKGVIIGDSVAIVEPKFSKIEVRHKEQVHLSLGTDKRGILWKFLHLETN